jgi:tRNA(Arg) A34 adenosine deaminase TadA
MADNFKSSVRQHINQLQPGNYRAIEREVAQKRLIWFGQNVHIREERPSPRTAFELLFYEYMGLSCEDLPVVSENTNEIVWLSVNKCPTLEACKHLGLDTRKVCRAVYEKSTQALLSQLDPQLRFMRSYEEIRPYSDHCKEMIVRVDFSAMIDLAIEEAHLTGSNGTHVNGAVVTMGNQIIAKAHAAAGSESDPSHHAVAIAIRKAVKKFGDANLCGAIIFSTCEPCPICSSLAVWANLTTIVYETTSQGATRLGWSGDDNGCHEIIDRSPAMIEIIAGRQADQW